MIAPFPGWVDPCPPTPRDEPQSRLASNTTATKEAADAWDRAKKRPEWTKASHRHGGRRTRIGLLEALTASPDARVGKTMASRSSDAKRSPTRAPKVFITSYPEATFVIRVA